MFDLEKTAQATAYLLRKYGGKLDYRKLMTLLYLADKEAIRQTYIPITGDDYYAIPEEELSETDAQ